jgi:hypothetical protein
MRIILTLTLLAALAAPVAAEITAPGNLLERTCDPAPPIGPNRQIAAHEMVGMFMEVAQGELTATQVKDFYTMEHCSISTEIACTLDTQCPGGEECDKSEAAEFDAILAWLQDGNALQQLTKYVRYSRLILLCDAPDTPTLYASGAAIRARIGY